MIKYEVTRHVTPQECDWLERTINPGEIVFQCLQPTYGCVNYAKGLSVTFNTKGDYPFFEIPKDAVEVIEI